MRRQSRQQIALSQEGCDAAEQRQRYDNAPAASDGAQGIVDYAMQLACAALLRSKPSLTSCPKFRVHLSMRPTTR
jgi:hypothetical protein